jgi:hypothetical protein
MGKELGTQLLEQSVTIPGRSVQFDAPTSTQK